MAPTFLSVGRLRPATTLRAASAHKHLEIWECVATQCVVTTTDIHFSTSRCP